MKLFRIAVYVACHDDAGVEQHVLRSALEGIVDAVGAEVMITHIDENDADIADPVDAAGLPDPYEAWQLKAKDELTRLWPDLEPKLVTS